MSMWQMEGLGEVVRGGVTNWISESQTKCISYCSK